MLRVFNVLLIDCLVHYQEFPVCPGCYVCCTDLAYSDQFATLKYDSPIFQSFDEVINFFPRSVSIMESLILERLSATKSSRFSLKPDLMVISLSLILLNFKKLKKNKQILWPFLWMGFNYLKDRATSRRQFTFYHNVPRNSWYSFYRPRKDERFSRPWSYSVVLNTGPMDSESSILTIRPLLQLIVNIKFKVI